MTTGHEWRDTAVLGLLVALLVMPVFDAGPVAQTTPSVGDDECYSEGCNRTASRFAFSIDATVNPCDDFYQFTCGGYVRKTDYPEDLARVSVISQMEDALREQVRGLLAEPASAADPSSFRKAKTLYGSCANKTRLQERGLEPARRIVEVAGGWPLLQDSWDETTFDWTRTLLKLEELGIGSGDILFDVEVDVDVTNTSVHVIQISPPDFNLDIKPLDLRRRAKRIFKYQEKFQKIALLFLEPNGTSNASSIKHESNDVVMFEANLNLQTKSLEDASHVVNNVNKMNVSSLQAEFPFVQWLDYLGRLLPPTANLTEADVVNVGDVGYLRALGEHLAKVPKRTLANYVVWRALESKVLPFLSEEVSSILNKEEIGDCVKLVQALMRPVTAAMYVRRFSSKESRSMVQEMVQDVSNEMRHLLDTVEWMDPVTRRQASMKAEAMKHNVGFPDELLNDTLLDDFYKRVEVHADFLLENTLALERDTRRRDLEKYRQPVVKNKWDEMLVYADVVNAFYHHPSNGISIPAGIMQGTFFQKDRPQYLNYGALGSGIGHEVSHAFDETGSLFNMHGQMDNWWEKATKKVFDEKVKCVVDMYSRMRSEELNTTVNGILTLSENIAESAGLKVAYRAYERYSLRHGPEQRLVIPVVEVSTEANTEASTEANTEASNEASNEVSPEANTEASPEANTEAGPEANTEANAEATTEATTEANTEASPEGNTEAVTETPSETTSTAEVTEDTAGPRRLISLSPKQMFWVSFASSWCSKLEIDELNTVLRTSNHLPGMYRVNGAVMNVEAFAADFDCPAGSPMNPIQRCEVW